MRFGHKRNSKSISWSTFYVPVTERNPLEMRQSNIGRLYEERWIVHQNRSRRISDQSYTTKRVHQYVEKIGGSCFGFVITVNVKNSIPNSNRISALNADPTK